MLIQPLVQVAPDVTPTALTTAIPTLVCANKVRIQAHPDNEGHIYLGSTAGMTPDTAFAILVPGATEWIGDERDGNVVQLGRIFVLASNATDKIQGAVCVR